MIDALQQFHFIRPFWLFGLFGLPILWLLMRKQDAQGNDWAQVIHPALLKHLTPSVKLVSHAKTHSLAILVLSFCFIGLAGPSWQQKPTPVIKTGNDLVIILDLSLSMLATDQKPNRLTRVKQKLEDLLNTRTEGNTALIVFSGDAHVVTPLTDDVRTILANMKALDPFIMPEIGSRPDIAVNMALDLIDQAKSVQPFIIMLTDGIEEKQAASIVEALNSSARKPSLSILAIGTQAGGPIDIPGQGYLKDKGQVILPKTDFSQLEQLASATSGFSQAISLDDTDLKTLYQWMDSGQLLSESSPSKNVKDRTFDTWEDMGFILVCLIIPLALLAYRQNALLLVLIWFSLPNESAQAFEWQDLWLTKDQQAQKLMQEQRYEEASELFSSPEHKAFAAYKAEKYEQAEQLYQQGTQASQVYNQANALAKQHKFEEALSKYEEALKLNPNFEDAQHNKTLIEELLRQQQEQQQSSDQQNSDQQNSDQQNSDQQNSDQQNSDQQNSEQQNSEQQNSEQQNSEQQNSEQQNSEQQNSEKENTSVQAQQELNEQEAKEALEQMKEQAKAEAASREELNSEEQQSYEQWMRRLPDDPGALLRRKFEQQAQERARNQQQRRQEGDPIW